MELRESGLGGGIGAEWELGRTGEGRRGLSAMAGCTVADELGG